MRVPGAPNGHATNRDPVNPSPPPIPARPPPAPATYNSPTTPAGTGTQPAVQHEQRRPRHRRTDRHHPRARHQRRADRRIHRRLGRAVGVDHHPPRRPPIHQLDRAGLTGHHQRRRLQPLRPRASPPPTGSDSTRRPAPPPARREAPPVSAATSSGTTTSRPPCNNAPQISHTETSKANECHCDHTCPASSRLSSNRRQQPSDVVVGDGHALGDTGGAGGVDQVGDVLGRRRRQARCWVGCQWRGRRYR